MIGALEQFAVRHAAGGSHENALARAGDITGGGYVAALSLSYDIR